MNAQHRALALAALCAAMLVPASVAQAGGANSIQVCHGTGSTSDNFVLVAVSGNASIGRSAQQDTNDFSYNPWYPSCAEQYADMGNH